MTHWSLSQQIFVRRRFSSWRRMVVLLMAATIFSSLQCCDAIESYVGMGVCEHLETNERRCVVQSSDCRPTHINGQKNVMGEKFVSVYQQRLQNKDNQCTCSNTPVHGCMTPLPDDPNSYLKECVPDPMMCDTDSGSMLTNDMGDDFMTCSCEGSRTDASNVLVSPTMYGACLNPRTDEHFCVFSPRDCESPHVWLEPADTLDVIGTKCTCDMVRTGGCFSAFTNYYNSDSICATSPGDCWDPSDYHAPVALKSKSGASCRLCDPTNGLQQVLEDEIDRLSKEPSRSGRLALGVLILVILFVGIASFMILHVTRRASAGKEPTSEIEPPSFDITDSAQKPPVLEGGDENPNPTTTTTTTTTLKPIV